MLSSIIKIFFGIPVFLIPFDLGLSFVSALLSLVGLTLILSGAAGIMNTVNNLRRRISTPSCSPDPS